MSTSDRPRPIVCAFDGSDASRNAVHAARWLGEALDATVLLAHIFDPMGIPTPPRGELVAASLSSDDLEHHARVRARERLDDAARMLDGVDHVSELRDGRPTQELLALVDDHDARLLITGAAVTGTLEHILIGSVSSELAATAPCPVLAAPRGAVLNAPGPVLAGYDGSDHSLRAARWAAGLAARMRRDLVLAHAIRDEDDERVRPDERLARALYDAAQDEFADASGRPPLDLTVTVAVEHGDPVDVLAAIGRERDAALVVMGSRGRGTLGATLLGSVSAGLVRRAERPVVLVSPRAG